MEIISRSEYEENENIQHWDKIQMSSMGGLLNKKFQKKEKQRAINSEQQALMKEIYDWSVSIGSPIKKFDMIYNFMATKGILWVRMCWEEVKQMSFPYQNVGTFINKVKSAKIKWL
jgi:hypothetical protein